MFGWPVAACSPEAWCPDRTVFGCLATSMSRAIKRFPEPRIRTTVLPMQSSDAAPGSRGILSTTGQHNSLRLLLHVFRGGFRGNSSRPCPFSRPRCHNGICSFNDSEIDQEAMEVQHAARPLPPNKQHLVVSTHKKHDSPNTTRSRRESVRSPTLRPPLLSNIRLIAIGRYVRPFCVKFG